MEKIGLLVVTKLVAHPWCDVITANYPCAYMKLEPSVFKEQNHRVLKLQKCFICTNMALTFLMHCI